MSKIRCPKCGRTNCDHDARHLAEADEIDRLVQSISAQGHPKQELPPRPAESIKELSDHELAKQLIEFDGEDGYRRAVGLVGREKANQIVSEMQVQKVV
ncbi:MAG: hypothetical protein PHD72_02660 [Patescibacteria group bacterium]|nr:hypothetical protein [Patescibacteria group bacterium]